MTAVAIIALTIALTSTGGLIYFARLAVQRADGKAIADASAATARGESAIDARKVDEANSAVGEIDEARKAAQDRQHAAETAFRDQAVGDGVAGDGDELLSKSIAATPATGGANEGDHGNRIVPIGSTNRSPPSE